MVKISTIIITYNEEDNLERCLVSVRDFSDEIIVVDSHSSDRTVEIARRHTSKIFIQDWLGFGPQKQLALTKATNEWVFSIDADEEVSQDLNSEIQDLRFDKAGYFVPRRVWYLNRWINHSGWYPGYVLRLFKKSEGRFSNRLVHESVEHTGSTARLNGDLLHYSYRDIAHHVEKMNQFTTLSALQMRSDGRSASLASLFMAPPYEFLKVYLLRGGFRDGLAGLVISVLHSIYVFLKYAKLNELKWGNQQGMADSTVLPESTERGAHQSANEAVK